jgi:sugar/nucleoside kinase (ribokinase family)
VEWLLVNEHEAESLATALDIDTVYPEIMDDLMDALPGLRGVLVTRGAQGVGASIRLQDGGTKQFSSPAGRPRGPIIDTTGAGDTFAVSGSRIKLEKKDD